MIPGGKDDAVIIRRVRAVIILGPEVSQAVKEQFESAMRLAAGKIEPRVLQDGNGGALALLPTGGKAVMFLLSCRNSERPGVLAQVLSEINRAFLS